jgi:hypothetical protein
MKLRLPAKYLDLKLRHLQVFETTDDPIERVKAVTGFPADTLRKMPHAVIIKADEHLRRLEKQEMSTHLKVIELDGVEYGFVPDWEEFTTGEWIDMEGYTKNFWPNAHKAMSLLYRPIKQRVGDSYTIEPYTAKEDARPFLDLPAPVVAGALLFFWNSEQELWSDLQSSLIQKAKEVMSFQQSGVGTPSSTTWRERIYSRWTRSRRSASAMPSHISPTSRTSPSSVSSK